MKDKVSSLIYTTRSLCEALHDRHDLVDHDDELKDLIEEVVGYLDEIAELDSDSDD